MPVLLKPQEAAARLRLSLSTVYHLVGARKIPFFKIGQKVLFDAEELAAWLAARRVAPIAYSAIAPAAGGKMAPRGRARAAVRAARG